MIARRRQDGLAIVEFAVSVPVLLFLMVATADIVRAFTQYSTLSNGVRDGTFYLARHSILGTSGVVNVSNATIDATRRLVMYGNIGGSGSLRVPGLATGQIAVTNAGGGNVRVVVTYPYQSLFGGTIQTFGIGSNISMVFNMVVSNTTRAISGDFP
jgi:Flp pilus assembly protein TadG